MDRNDLVTDSEKRDRQRRNALIVVSVLGLVSIVAVVFQAYRIGFGLAFYRNLVDAGHFENRIDPLSELWDQLQIGARINGVYAAIASSFAVPIPITVLILSAVWFGKRETPELFNVVKTAFITTLVGGAGFSFVAQHLSSVEPLPAFLGGIILLTMLSFLIVGITNLVIRSSRKKAASNEKG